MSLHDRIMKMDYLGDLPSPEEIGGFLTAQRKAATLAAEADELMREMGNALASAYDFLLSEYQQGKMGIRNNVCNL